MEDNPNPITIVISIIVSVIASVCTISWLMFK